MARQANQVSEIIDDAPLSEELFSALQNSGSQISTILNEVEKSGKLVGLSEAFTILGNFSDLGNIATYEMLKKTKGYKYLVNDKTGNYFQNLDEYCQERMPYSRRRLDDLVKNRNIIGKELYEKAEQIGLRQIDYNALKALPAPEQELVRRAIDEAETKDEVVNLLQDLATQYTKEKGELQRQLKSTQDDYKALDKRVTDVRKEKEDIALKLAQFEMKTVPLDERLDPFKRQIENVQSRINEQLEQQRQLVKMMDELQKEIMQDDPNYLPDEPYSLPPAIQIVLMALHESLKMTLAQAKTTYRELWLNFTNEVESAMNEGDQVINETINDLI